MLINTEETKLMLIASRQKRHTLIDENLKLEYNNLELQISSMGKFWVFIWMKILSGITISCKFPKKISSYLCLLSQSRTYLTKQHRLLYYNAYINPHLEYCCVVWGNSSNFNTYKIETLYRRACKLILGNDYTTLENARKQIHILSFGETMFIHKAKIMYKIANNVAPNHLTDLFQMRGNANNWNTAQLKLQSMSNRNFLIPKPKINLFKKSFFFYSGAHVWNSILLWTKNSSTIQSFTNNCLKWINSDSIS